MASGHGDFPLDIFFVSGRQLKSPEDRSIEIIVIMVNFCSILMSTSRGFTAGCGLEKKGKKGGKKKIAQTNDSPFCHQIM